MTQLKDHLDETGAALRQAAKAAAVAGSEGGAAKAASGAKAASEKDDRRSRREGAHRRRVLRGLHLGLHHLLLLPGAVPRPERAHQQDHRHAPQPGARPGRVPGRGATRLPQYRELEPVGCGQPEPGQLGQGSRRPGRRYGRSGRIPVLGRVRRFVRRPQPEGQQGHRRLASGSRRHLLDPRQQGEVLRLPGPAEEHRRPRGLGLLAAYVSGYIRTIPAPGAAPLEGADASHAWMSLWCGESHGSIDLDPTNAILVENDHVVIAVGRDYADVSPIDGVIFSAGRQKLDVSVSVTPVTPRSAGKRKSLTLVLKEPPQAASRMTVVG